METSLAAEFENNKSLESKVLKLISEYDRVVKLSEDKQKNLHGTTYYFVFYKIFLAEIEFLIKSNQVEKESLSKICNV